MVKSRRSHRSERASERVRCTLPLDAERQHDAVVSFQGFLTFVGGACVPDLKARKHNAKLW